MSIHRVFYQLFLILFAVVIIGVTAATYPRQALAVDVNIGGYIKDSNGTIIPNVYVFMYFTDTGTWADPNIYTASKSNDTDGSYWFTIPSGRTFSLFPQYNGSFGGSGQPLSSLDICPIGVKCYSDISPYPWDYQGQTASADNSTYNFTYTLPCPSGTTYQPINTDASWIVEGCGSTAGLNDGITAILTNVTVTNKTNGSLGMRVDREKWQCYVGFTNPEGHSHCEQASALAPGHVTDGESITVEAKQKTLLSRVGSVSSISQSNPADTGSTSTMGPICGAAQVDYWFNRGTTNQIGPLFGYSLAVRGSAAQPHCQSGDFAIDPLPTPTTPVGSNLTLNGTIRNIGHDYTWSNPAFTIPGSINGSNYRFRLDVGNNGDWNEVIIGSLGSAISSADNENNYVLLPPRTTDWITTLGTHKYELCVNYDNQIVEALNGDTNNCAQKVFTVTNGGGGDPSLIDFTCSPNLTSINTGQSVIWNRSIIEGGVFPYNHSWNFDTGGSASTCVNPPSGCGAVANPTVNYSTAGNKIATLTITDSSTPPQSSGVVTCDTGVSVVATSTPTVNLSVSPTGVSNPKNVTLLSDSTFTLTWTTTNTPDSCTASGNWSGARTNTGGSSTLGPLAPGSYTYSIFCTKGGVNTSIDSVNVSVIAPPTVDLKGKPTNSSTAASDGPITVVTGNTATMSWASANTDSCTASSTGNVWTGVKLLNSASDLTTTLSFPDSYTLTLTCVNSSIPVGIAARSVADTLVINMAATAPAVPSTAPWIQTIGGDVHSNKSIITPGGP